MFINEYGVKNDPLVLLPAPTAISGEEKKHDIEFVCRIYPQTVLKEFKSWPTQNL